MLKAEDLEVGDILVDPETGIKFVVSNIDLGDTTRPVKLKADDLKGYSVAINHWSDVSNYVDHWIFTETRFIDFSGVIKDNWTKLKGNYGNRVRVITLDILEFFETAKEVEQSKSNFITPETARLESQATLNTQRSEIVEDINNRIKSACALGIFSCPIWGVSDIKILTELQQLGYKIESGFLTWK